VRQQVSFLPDRRRLHLQDGPIDLVIQAFGGSAEVKAAYDAAIIRFQTVLDELCSELSLLRRPAGPDTPMPKGTIATRMATAVAPYAERIFITPMAAVAGAVAEEILEAMTSATKLSKAYVNDGGDIAVHLAPGEQFVVGMIDRPDRPSLLATAVLGSSDSVHGIATSGYRGRSFSLGIADAVTVLAKRAAMADAAATVIANAVDLPGHPKVHRVSARSIDPDSDLGDRPVTRFVGELSAEDIMGALDQGAAVAEQVRSEGLIHSAALLLQRGTRIVTMNDSITNVAGNRELCGSRTHA
jgi:uncharacterized protein